MVRRTVRLLDGHVIAYVETANLAYSENASLHAKCNKLHDSEAGLTMSRRLGGSCLGRANGSAQANYDDLCTVQPRCYRKFDRSEILSLRSYFLGNFIAERYFFLGNIIAARKFDRSRCHGS